MSAPVCAYCEAPMSAAPLGDGYYCSACKERHFKEGQDHARREFAHWLRERLKLVDEALAGKL